MAFTFYSYKTMSIYSGFYICIDKYTLMERSCLRYKLLLCYSNPKVFQFPMDTCILQNITNQKVLFVSTLSHSTFFFFLDFLNTMHVIQIIPSLMFEGKSYFNQDMFIGCQLIFSFFLLEYFVSLY